MAYREDHSSSAHIGRKAQNYSASNLGKDSKATPIKSLQAKHRHLEAQLAKLSAEVAHQRGHVAQSNSSQKYSTSNQSNVLKLMTSPKAAHYASANSTHGHLNLMTNKRPQSRDRVASSKRIQARKVGVGKGTDNSATRSPFSPPVERTTNIQIMKNTSQQKLTVEKKKQLVELLNQGKLQPPASGVQTFQIGQLARKNLKQAVVSNKKKQHVLSQQVRSVNQSTDKKGSKRISSMEPSRISANSMTKTIENKPNVNPDVIKVMTSISDHDFGTDNKQINVQVSPGISPIAKTQKSPAKPLLMSIQSKPDFKREREPLHTFGMTSHREPSDFRAMTQRTLGRGLVKNLEEGIMNLHSNLKTLEGKYLDLANFYKQELVKDQPSGKADPVINNMSSNSSSGFKYQSPSLPSRSGRDDNQEQWIIDEVKNEKLKLESQLKNLISLHEQIMVDESEEKPIDVLVKATLKKHEQELSDQLGYGRQLQPFQVSSTFLAMQNELLSQIASQAPAQGVPESDTLKKLLSNFEIQQEYALSNLKEQCFQIQHANDQIKLDLKRVSLSLNSLSQQQLELKHQGQDPLLQSLAESVNVSVQQLSSGFGLINQKIQHISNASQELSKTQDQSVSQLKEYGQEAHSILNQSRPGIETESKREKQQLESKVAYQQDTIQMLEIQMTNERSTLETQLRSLRDQNVDLKTRCDLLATDLQNKDEIIAQRDQHNEDTLLKLKDAQSQLAHANLALTHERNQQSSEQVSYLESTSAHWRQTCDSLAKLVTSFMHSMRRLQKVVHRKEENVAAEKQEFENSKKNLEVTLKQIKKQLAIPQSSHPLFHNQFDDHLPQKQLTAQKLEANRVNPVSSSARPFTHQTQAVDWSAQAKPLRVTQRNQLPASASQTKLYQAVDMASSGSSKIVIKPATDPVAQPHTSQNSVHVSEALESLKQQLETTEKEVVELRADNNLLTRKLQREKSKVANLQQDFKDQQILNEKLKHQIKDQSQLVNKEELQSVEYINNELKKTISKLEQNEQTKTEEIKKLESQIEMIGTAVEAKVSAETTQLKEDNIELQKQIQSIQSSLDESQEQNNRLLSSIKSYQDQILALESQVTQLQAQLHELQQDFTTMEDQKSAQISAHYKQTQKSMQLLQSGCDRIILSQQERGDELQQKVTDYLKQIDKISQTIGFLELKQQEQVLSIENQKTTLNQESSELQQQLAEKQKELKQALKDYQKFQQSHEQLLQNQKNANTELQRQIQLKQQELETVSYQLVTEQKEKQQTEDTLRDQIKSLEQQNKKLLQDNDAREQKTKEQSSLHDQVVSELTSRLQQAQIEVSKTQTSYDEVKSQLKMNQMALINEKKKVEDLQTELDQLNSKVERKRQKSKQQKLKVQELHHKMEAQQEEVLQVQELAVKAQDRLQAVQSEAESKERDMKQFHEAAIQQTQQTLKERLESSLKQKLLDKQQEIDALLAQQNEQIELNQQLQSQADKLQSDLAQIKTESLQQQEQNQQRIQLLEDVKLESSLELEMLKQKNNQIQLQLDQTAQEVEQKQDELNDRNAKLLKKKQKLAVRTAELEEHKQRLQVSQTEYQENRSKWQLESQDKQEQLKSQFRKCDELQSLLESKDDQINDLQSQLESQVLSKDDQINQLQTQLASLKEAQDKDITDLQTQLESQIEAKDEKISELQTQLESQPDLEDFSKQFAQSIKLQELVDAQNQELIDFVTNFEKIEQDLKDKEAKAAKDKEAYESEIQNLKNKIDENQEEIEELKEAQQSNEQDKEEAESRVAELTEETTSLQQQLDLKISEYQDLQAEFDEYKQTKEEELSDLKSICQQRQSSIDALNKQLESLQGSESEQQIQNKQLIDEIQSLQLQNSDIQNQINQLKEEKQEMELESEKYQEQIMNYDKESVRAQQQFDQAQSQLETEIEQKITQVDELTKKIQDLEDKIESLTQQKEELNLREQTLNQEQQEIKSRHEDVTTFLNTRIKNLQDDVRLIEDEKTEMQADLLKQIKQLTGERDQAQDQLKDMINSSKQEQSSLEQQLKSQVNQVMAQLDAKEQQVETLQSLIQELKQTQAEIDKESKHLENQVESLEQQLLNSESKHSDLQNQAKAKEQQFEEDLAAAKETLSAREKELSQLRAENQKMKEDLDLAETSKQQLSSQIQTETDEKESQIESLKDQLESLQGKTVDQEQKIKSLTAELKAQQEAQQQQLQALNLTLAQKESELSQAQADLKELESTVQSKEKEIADLNQQIKDNETVKQQLELKEQEIQKTQSQIKDREDTLSEAEEIRLKHLKTLEQNKELITKLKNELKKNIDRRKDAEVKLKSQNTSRAEESPRSANKSMEAARLRDEVEQFKNKLVELKKEYSSKVEELQGTINEKDQEIESYKEMTEEADKLLNAFNQEKHDIKAKFKHLMQLIAQTNFTASQPFQSSDDGVPTISSYKGREDEVDLNDCFEELENIVLTQKSTLENRISQLVQDNKSLDIQVKEQQKDLEQTQLRLSELKCELMNAQNKHETNDVEVRRQIETASRKINNYKEKLAEKVQAIAALEQQLALKEKELQDAQKPELAKNNSLDVMQESFSTLQQENLELLQKLQKAEQELQKARNQEESFDSFDRHMQAKQQQQQKPALTEDQTKQINDLIKQTTNLKKDLMNAKEDCVKSLEQKYQARLNTFKQLYCSDLILDHQVTADKTTGWNNQVKECKEVQFDNIDFLLVKLVQQDQYCVVPQSKLSDQAIRYLKAFVDEESEPLIDQAEVEETDEVIKLKALVSDLKQDRVELEHSLIQMKDSTGPKKSLKVEELQDDIDYLTTENKELTLKVKDVCYRNAELKLQIAQLKSNQSDKHKEMFSGDDLDAQEIRNELAFQDELQRKFSGTSQQEIENIDDELAEEGQIVVAGSDNQFNDIEDGAGFMSPGEDSFRDVVKGMEPVSDVQHLKTQLEALANENQELKDLLKQKESELQLLGEDDQEKTTLAHIKGTLFQFLKNTPFTEKGNEELLQIIYSMMDFTKEEVHELEINRAAFKHGKKTPVSSVKLNTSNISESSDPNKKKGLLSIFKKDKSKQNLSASGPSPIKQLSYTKK